MKRLPFLASLLGFSVAAKAQSSLPVNSGVVNTPYYGSLNPASPVLHQSVTTLPKPANGDCPICGTHFKPKTAAADDDGEPYIHGCRHCRVLYYIEVE